jgi:predicted kinase
VRFVALEVAADAAVVRKRMGERAESGGASDARWSVYVGQRERFEAPDEIAPDEIARLDGGASLRANVEAALRLLASAGQ